MTGPLAPDRIVSQHPRIFLRDRAPVLLAAVLGLLISAAVSLALYQSERGGWLDTLTHTARTWQSQLERRLADIGLATELLARRLSAEPTLVEAAAFDRLAESLLARHPAVTEIAWLPRTTSTDATLARAGYSRGRMPGAPTPVPESEVPTTALASALSLNQATLSGAYRRSDKLRPVMTLFQPVTAPGTPDRVQGAVAVSLHPDILLGAITGGLAAGTPALRVLDRTAPDAPNLVYQTAGSTMSDVPLIDVMLPVASRSWQIIAAPPASGMPLARFSPALLALAIGLVGTALLVLHLAGLRRRGRAVEQQIALGTQALLEVNTNLRRNAEEREKALRALAESEARYRLLADHANDIISRQDQDGDITYVSPASRAILGYEPGELVGRRATHFVHADDWPAVRERLRAGDGSCTATFRVRHRDGHHVWLETVHRNLGPADGGTPGSLSISRDVTARMEAERALRDSEYLFRRVFESTAVGMAFFSPAGGRFLRANHALTEMLGYSTSELEEMTIADITHPADQHISPSEMQQMLAGAKDSFVVEKRYLHKNGSTVWILGNNTLIREPDGEPRYFVSQIQDISERKRAAQRLARLSHRQDLILHAAGEGIYGVDAEGNATFVNRAAAEMLGYDPADLVGVNMHTSTHDAGNAGAPAWEDCRVRRSIRDRETHYVDNEVFRHRDGHPIHVQYVSSPIIDQGRASGAVVVFSELELGWTPEVKEGRPAPARSDTQRGVAIKRKTRSDGCAEP